MLFLHPRPPPPAPDAPELLLEPPPPPPTATTETDVTPAGAVQVPELVNSCCPGAGPDPDEAKIPTGIGLMLPSLR